MNKLELYRIPTRSAAWHWIEAERYMSLASHMRAEPGPNGAQAVNTYDQMLWATLANAHAQLAAAGAALLAERHGRGREAMLAHAEGRGNRANTGDVPLP